MNPSTVACQAPLSIWGSPGNNTGVSCHFLLQGIFPTQGWNLGLLLCRQILYWLTYEESSRSESKVTRSCPDSAMLWTLAHKASQSMGFSRQEYWSGLPFPSPGVLPNQGIKPRSPTLGADSTISTIRESFKRSKYRSVTLGEALIHTVDCSVASF